MLALAWLSSASLQGLDKASPAGMGLAEARQAMSGISAGNELSARLGSLCDSLSAADSVSLIMEFAAKARAEDRAALFRRGADTALLLGNYSLAAEAYASAARVSATGGPELLLKAARCQLAAGEGGKARDLLALVLLDSGDPLRSIRARLAGAWALLLEGRRSEALGLASELAVSSTGAEKREARLLQWAASPTEGRARLAELLASDFPGSPEALIASGSLPPLPTPHWYLGALAGPATIPATPSPATPAGPAPGSLKDDPNARAEAQSQSAKAEPSTPPGKVLRYQVGFFAREENATRLKAELGGKGIAARIEKRDSPGGQRWIVLVEAGSDAQKTGIRLKDAGYEAYPQF